ncbi:MAG: hypothetical protein OSA97_06630 [Nevskia sp.]|nr:hypothetical protein [Nevskia sp.]
MNRIASQLVLALVCGAISAALPAADTQPPSAAATLPDYQPEQMVGGDIRIWASPEDAALLQGWAEGFRRSQPQARVLATLHGPESTMAGVYNGVADLALLAREMREPVEDMAFTWVYLHKPFSVEVANAGLKPGRPSTTLAVYVHRGNPLQQLSLAQLDGILGAEHRRGGSNLRSWGDLGLSGAWKDQAIHLHGPPVDSIQALFVRTAVLQDSYKWNPAYQETPGDGSQAVRDLNADSAGIAFGPAGIADDANVKAVALGVSDAGPFTTPTTAAVVDRSYPLSRVITLVLNRAPGKPIEPAVYEFLRYVLSAEGQAAVARAGSYIPLSAASAGQQLSRLR